MSWTASAGVTVYAVFRNTTDDIGSASEIGTTESTSFSDDTVLAGVTYYYWVTAENDCGSSTSDPATFTACCEGWRAGPLNEGGAGVTSVNAMTTLGSRVVAGGAFDHPTGDPQAANNIVAYNGLLLSRLGLGMDGPVFALKSFTHPSGDHELIGGGEFTSAGGITADFIARWVEDPLGFPPAQWAPMGSGFNSSVFAIERFNNATIAAGQFDLSGGTAVNRIARWNEETRTWQPMGAGAGGGMNGSVRALKAYSLPSPPLGRIQLVAGGSYTTAGGAAANRIASWTDSTIAPGSPAWTAMGAGFDGTVLAIERHAGSTYAGGDFTASGATTLNRIARWVPSSSSWVPVGNGTGFNGTVSALKSSGANLYAAGSFTTVDGVTARRIARWNGSDWESMQGDPNAEVTALALYNNELHAGGSFDTLNNETLNSPGWARYLETGVPWIAQQPLPQTVNCGDEARFSIEPAQGYDGLSYEWRKDNVPLAPGPTGTGSTIVFGESDVVVQNPGPADAGAYHCVLANGCGSATSLSATLTVTGCPGDCDEDGDVDWNDHADFASCLRGPFGDVDLGCECSDFDGDNDVDLLDFAEFQLLFMD